MDVYQYISENNPDAANGVCIKYGYTQIKNIGELAGALQTIVATHGETALKSIMDVHPEKDTILELFQKKEQPEVKSKPDCSCNSGIKMGADGTVTQPSSTANQTNTYILVAALIVSISIISMKK